MKYTFLFVYHNFENDKAGSLRLAQDLVLEEWRAAVSAEEIPFIKEAKVSFKDWAINEYPDQQKARDFILRRYTNSRGVLYAAGMRYDDPELLLADLNLQKRLIELTVEEVN